MRGLMLLAAAVVAASAFAVSTSSAPSASSAGYRCNQSVIVILFWPHGHGAIKSVNFAAYRTPHLEVYRYAAGYKSADFLAFADAKGVTNFVKTCKKSAGSPLATPIVSAKRVTAQRALSCSVTKSGTLWVTKTKAGLRLDVASGLLHIASVSLLKVHSNLTYGPLCRAGPPPS